MLSFAIRTLMYFMADTFTWLAYVVGCICVRNTVPIAVAASVSVNLFGERLMHSILISFICANKFEAPLVMCKLYTYILSFQILHQINGTFFSNNLFLRSFTLIRSIPFYLFEQSSATIPKLIAIGHNRILCSHYSWIAPKQEINIFRVEMWKKNERVSLSKDREVK